MAYNLADCNELAEDQENDVELQDFKGRCRYVKDFLSSIKSTQGKEMPEDLKWCLDDMKVSIESFVQEQNIGVRSKEPSDARNKRDYMLSKPSSTKQKVSITSERNGKSDKQVSIDRKRYYNRKGRSSSSEQKVSIHADKDAKVNRQVSIDRRRGKSRSHHEKKRNGRRRKEKKYSSSSSAESESTSRSDSSSSKETSDIESSDEWYTQRRSRTSTRKKPGQKSRQRTYKKTEDYDRDSSESISRRRGLDYRQAPKMEKFREESGCNIEHFFKKFEEYCRKNIRGGRNFWINVLEDHLEGSVVETFNQLRDQDDDYEDAKEKLIKWYKDSAEVRRKSHKKKFGNARPKSDESLYLFSIKLASLFKKAYPKHDMKKSKKLIDQFKKSIPRKMRETLDTQIMTRKMEGRKVDWNFVQKCMKLKDIDNHGGYKESGSDDEPKKKVKEVEINLGHEKHYGNNPGRMGRNRSSSSYRPERAQSTQKSNECFTCGRSGHFSRECRWNLGLCIICGQDNHLANNCPNRRELQAHSRDETPHRSRTNLRGRGGYNPGGQGSRGNMNSYDSYGNQNEFRAKGTRSDNFRGEYNAFHRGRPSQGQDGRPSQGQNRINADYNANRPGWFNAPEFRPRSGQEALISGEYTEKSSAHMTNPSNGMAADNNSNKNSNLNW